MPIYAYLCAQCGHPFDQLQKLDAPDPTVCPVCQSGPVTRQVTAPHVRLSGKGWYETDFKAQSEQRHVVHPDVFSKDPTP